MNRPRFLEITALALVTIAGEIATAGVASAETGESRLREAVARALAQNPEIAEMEFRIEAAKRRVPQARALPDPKLTAGAVNVPLPDFSFVQDDMTMKMLSVEQMLPAPGKRRVAARVADAEVEIAEAMHAAHVNRLVAEVVDAFFETAELDARLAIARRSLERLGRVSESTRARYRVGQGALPEALLAGVEETKMRDRIRALQAQRLASAARLNALQGVPPDEQVPPIEVRVGDRSVPGPETVLASVEKSPDVVAAQAEVRRSERDLELARLERRPDLSLAASYGARERRDDMIGATVGINLPFFQAKRVAARIAEKEAQLGAARKRLDAVRLTALREAAQARIALASEIERAVLYRDTVLTQDRTAAEAAEEAYSVGRIDYETYVRAVLAIDEDESEAVMREAAIPRARAKLLAVAGLPLEEVSHD